MSDEKNDVGEWQASDNGQNIYSDRFETDAMLVLSGNFGSVAKRKRYADQIARDLSDITALRAEVERLTKNEDHLRRTAGGWFDRAHERRLEADDLRSQVSARDAEVRALREDAARYRWLRKGGFNLPDLPYRRQSFAKSVAEIEAAIDRCRRADGEDDNA